MSYAYTPGLKIKKYTVVRKRRILPIAGEVLVKDGDVVKDDTIVARSFIRGDITMINLAYKLGVEPWELPRVMLKKEGDEVKEGELIAVSKGFFGLFKNEYKSEVTGTIELISNVTGMVGIRGPARPIQVEAYIPGKVINIEPKMGAIIETKAALIQGIFGIGGEKHGEIMTVAEPNEILTENHIGKDCNGKILVGGSLATWKAVKKAEGMGVKGIVTGGIYKEDLSKALGYDLGVAITGHENIVTCIITEGFGELTMTHRTYELLKSLEGRRASVNGATQIRAGVIRPEIIVPWIDDKDEASTEIEGEDSSEHTSMGMEKGTRVRVIRKPYFGIMGRIVGLPPKLQKLESESYARVAEIELDDGRRVIVPRANVEIFEE